MHSTDKEILLLRINLWEYSTNHSLYEVRQKAIDDICKLTNSPIGFYHDINNDQETIFLQCWSTETKRTFCKAIPKEHTYKISDAGVWVEPIYTKKPVFHNNYENVPNKKGLQKGHAVIIRELVVPTIRNNKVVSLLGIGNKNEDYTEDDCFLVEFVADAVWSVIEQKQSYETIQKINDKLQTLSITDDLTNIYNVRHFNYICNEKIKSFLRYNTTFYLLLIDIDNFKTINDTYGHNVGDMVLIHLANIIKNNSRNVDYLFRIGGDEFAIIIDNSTIESSFFYANRIKDIFYNTPITLGEKIIQTSISIGISIISKDCNTIKCLKKKADAALYLSKQFGRNCIKYVE